jgi:hypothetical protein
MDPAINRKEFLSGLGKCCLGSCMCAAALGASSAFGSDSTGADSTRTAPETAGQGAGEAAKGAGSSETGATTPAAPPRSQARIEFAEKWVRRFFDVLDTTLDPATRKKVMLAAGRACFLEYIKESGQEIKPTTVEWLAAWAAKNATDGSMRVEDNVIYYQYMSAAETGLPSEEGACLCPLVETKPAGLSGTYCLCSVGYVQQWHEMMLDRPVEVELLESTLTGGKRCKFKITVG